MRRGYAGAPNADGGMYDLVGLGAAHAEGVRTTFQTYEHIRRRGYIQHFKINPSSPRRPQMTLFFYQIARDAHTWHISCVCRSSTLVSDTHTI